MKLSLCYITSLLPYITFSHNFVIIFAKFWSQGSVDPLHISHMLRWYGASVYINLRWIEVHCN